MLRADLYEKRMSLLEYISGDDCRACGFLDREAFLEGLRSGRIRPEQCRMAEGRFRSLLWAARPEEILPPVEVLALPAPGPTGLFPVNNPMGATPILVSGNSRLTMEVLTAVLSTTLSPFWYLVVDTAGHTVDMALVYKEFTADRILQALRRERVLERAANATIYLPGLAAGLSGALEAGSGRQVTSGPVCAAELPLFFGERHWKLPQ